MWRLTLSGVAAHRRRFAMTALAVVIGVAFLAGTLVLTDTIHSTFNNLYDQIYQGTTAMVRARQAYQPLADFTSQRQQIDASLAPVVARVPGVRAVALDIGGYAQLLGRNGKALGNPGRGAPTLGEAWVDVAALNPLRLVPGGHPPRHADEVVIDQRSATVGHLRVGDAVTVLSKLPPARYRIVGIATWGSESSPLGATITAFTPATAARVLGQPGKADDVAVEGAPGISQQQLAGRIRAALHDARLEVVTGQTVISEDQDAFHRAISIFDNFLLVFAMIALFVAAFLIFNTFSIVVAQRSRELALLRAVGASRTQVTLSVTGEAAVVGLLASIGGLVAGTALAVGLRAMLGALGMVLPAQGLVVAPRTVLVALGAGTAVTVVSGLMPARRAAAVPPVVAMQDAGAEPRTTTGRRAPIGAAVTLVGAALLAAGLLCNLSNRAVVVGIGAAAIFVGLSILGPLIARPLAAAIGRLVAARGLDGRLARENAMRHPARTSATASALMVGVALVSLMTVLAGSINSSVSATIDSGLRADFVINSGSQPGQPSGLSPGIETALRHLPQVSLVAGIRGAEARLYGAPASILATDPATSTQLFDIGVQQGSPARMTPSGIAVSTTAASTHDLRLGSTVLVTFPTTGTQRYRVQLIYSARAIAGDYVLTLPAAIANFPQQVDSQVYVKLAPGVPLAAGRRAVQSIVAGYPGATLYDQSQYKAEISKQVNASLNMVDSLLVLAIAIALLGIANTLALSVDERTHELGLLRAVGMTRPQVRAMVRSEALVVSLIGALEGLVLGVVLGAAIVASLRNQGITHLDLPLARLVATALLAALAGMLAAARPARRAARLDVLQAIATE
jgi:putative ABC transport system permease protein